MNPKVSVIMSTYREPIEYLIQSVESILNQTYNNFEFLIAVDDPKNFSHVDLLGRYSLEDSRIKLIINPINLGTDISRNNLAKLAKGDYIAIMDADDISQPERLEVQFNHMENHRDIGILGTGAFKMDKNGFVYGKMNVPTSSHCIKIYLTNGLMPMVHPTIMVRKSVFEFLGGYRKVIVEDLDLLLRADFLGIKMANLEESLLKYRIYKSVNRISSSKGYYQNRAGKYILHEIRLKRLSLNQKSFRKFVFKKGRIDNFLKVLYSFSKDHFGKACDYKSQKRWFRFILHFMLSLVSPAYVFDVYRLLKAKILCKLAIIK